MDKTLTQSEPEKNKEIKNPGLLRFFCERVATKSLWTLGKGVKAQNN